MRCFYIGVTMLFVTGICGEGTWNATLTAWTESNIRTSPVSSLDITHRNTNTNQTEVYGTYGLLGFANIKGGNNNTNEDTNKTHRDDHHNNRKKWWIQILVPCLVMAVLILATCVFILWRRNRKLKRNQKALGGANIHISHGSVLNLEEVDPGKKMVTIYIATKKPSEDPCDKQDPIYQEIPATLTESFQILQNPLYNSGGHHSQETPSRQQVQLKEDSSYSLLGLPARP
ncbi:uncharacterized protein [Aquarana catesbeiana]|uniref:uncharacterized protein n=1 Tax=Aquarana catesbeiana TaxID=8400 RepID=UPI003CCA399D